MDFIAIFAVFFVLPLCLAFKWFYSYWTRRKIFGPAPLPIFGHYFEYFFMQKHLKDVLDEIYGYSQHYKYIGFYKYFQPCILLKDLNIINRIVDGDLTTYYEPIITRNDNLHFLWKENVLRSQDRVRKSIEIQVKTLFTREKFSETYRDLQNSADALIRYVMEKSSKDSAALEVKEISSKYLIDAVARIAFFIKTDCLTPKNLTNDSQTSVYFELYKKYFAPNNTLNNLDLVKQMFEKVSIEQKVLSALENAEKLPRNIKERRRSSLFDEFFILEKDDSVIEKLIAILDAFEICSTLITFTLYQLATNQEIQSKVQSELKELLYLTENELNEQGLKKLFYLDAVLFETLRYHSAVIAQNFRCKVDHQLPPQSEDGTAELTVTKGIVVIVPFLSIHLDARNFPEPWKFYPERYLRSSSTQVVTYPFPGFGKDSKFCLGNHFAFNLAKLAIAKLIRNFTIEISNRLEIPLTFSKKTAYLNCENGIWLNFNKRKS